MIEQIVFADWSGYEKTIAIVKTNDGKGKILTTLYRPANVGDQVSLDVDVGVGSETHIHANVSKEEK